MDRPIRLADDIFWVGVNDRETNLFEGLWPLPGGISYNAYVVSGERAALVDAVREPFLGEYLGKVEKALPKGRRPEFLVINHIEPDHAGALKVLRAIFPGLTIVGNKWTLRLLERYHGITEGTQLVGDGDVLDLGSRELRFTVTPMVHWPETMVTLETTTGTLFTGDLFGGYGALDGGLSDEEVDGVAREDETRRYFANVLAKFSPMVLKALDRIRGLDCRTIAPAHGILWRDSPARVMEWFERWSRQEGEDGAVVAYGSMYRNTERLAEAVAVGLSEGGVRRIAVHDLARSHASYVLSDAWKYGILALGSATYNAGLFPPVAGLVALLADKGLKGRRVGIFGSYGWSGGAVKRLREFAASGKMELVGPEVEIEGKPGEDDLDECRRLGRALAQKTDSV